MTYEKFIQGVQYMRPGLDRGQAKKFFIKLSVCLITLVAFLIWVFYRTFRSDLVIAISLISGLVFIASTLRAIVNDIEYFDIWFTVSKFWFLFIVLAIIGGGVLWYYF